MNLAAYSNDQINEMAVKLGTLDATNRSDIEAVSSFALTELMGYRKNTKDRLRDMKTLELIIVAYARLLQESGVKA